MCNRALAVDDDPDPDILRLERRILRFQGDDVIGASDVSARRRVRRYGPASSAAGLTG